MHFIDDQKVEYFPNACLGVAGYIWLGHASSSTSATVGFGAKTGPGTQVSTSDVSAGFGHAGEVVKNTKFEALRTWEKDDP